MGALLIVDDDVIDGDAALSDFPTRWAAEKSQSCAWKAVLDFREQRQRENRIAEKTRLQHQDVFPLGSSHDL